MRKNKILAIALVILALVSCGFTSDPAVRLAECMERATKAGELSSSCDLEVSGGYVVVLHPAGELTDEELTAAGVPPDLVPSVRSMRNAQNGAIYVFADSEPASRTTYQNNFVTIPKALGVRVDGGRPLTLELERVEAGFVVSTLR